MKVDYPSLLSTAIGAAEKACEEIASDWFTQGGCGPPFFSLNITAQRRGKLRLYSYSHITKVYALVVLRSKIPPFFLE